MENSFDMIVIGGGPGGYTAALYGARAGMKVLVLEKLSAGGQMALTHQIDNYPGFPQGVDGFTLGMLMQEQAERFGVRTELEEVTEVKLDGRIKIVNSSGGTFYGKTVVLATGANPRELGIPMERELTGKGVNYCAACDGMFYKNRTVVVVGGGNTAAADALSLSRIAKKVYLVHRRDTLRATKIYHKPLMEAENVEFIPDSEIVELLHGEKLSGVRLRNRISGEERVLEAEGLFISIGRKPATGLVRGQIALDSDGYVIAGEDTATSLPGVFAVGDLRTKELRQIVTAVADGAMAVHRAEAYLAEG